MLEIKNFTKCYTKGKPTVKNISLTVEDGDIFAFVGHNGAGKTTTIKSIVGISNFDEGDILIDGKSIKTNEIECKPILSVLAQVKNSRSLNKRVIFKDLKKFLGL